MTTPLHLRLPNSLHKQLQVYAEQDGISVDQFVASAVAEKLASLATAEYLDQRARRGDQNNYHAVLAKVPNVDPEADDQLPEE